MESSNTQYSDPVYEKFKGVLKGAEFVYFRFIIFIGESSYQIPTRTIRLPPHWPRKSSYVELPLCKNVWWKNDTKI
jgi:hypothetical protein